MVIPVLFRYTFVANVVMVVVPHESVMIWYGANGVLTPAAVATVGR